jgi:hypothetical protein
MRRATPEPPAGPPEIQFEPGMAKQLLRELAPVLAEDGIDVDNIDVPDMETLQRALDRAVERQNLALFTPVGPARDLAVDALRSAVTAIADGDSVRAAKVLGQVKPESPDGSTATVSACIGVAVGLLDDWLSGQNGQAPTDLSRHTRLPTGHWFGERAATDLLALAGRGKAFRSMDRVIARQGGEHVLFGSTLALAAATRAWADHTNVPIPDLSNEIIR